MLGMLGGELINQFDNIKSVRSKVKVCLERQETVNSLGAGDSIDIPAPGQRDRAVGEQLQMPGHLAFRLSQALGKALNFAQMGSIEGEDTIRLTKFGFLDDDSFGLVITRTGHSIP